MTRACSKIVVGDDDNAGDGFVITDIDLITNTLRRDQKT